MSELETSATGTTGAEVKEVSLLDGFFNLTARKYLQTHWTAGNRS